VGDVLVRLLMVEKFKTRTFMALFNECNYDALLFKTYGDGKDVKATKRWFGDESSGDSGIVCDELKGLGDDFMA
jgi:hypothetical protein